MGFLASCKTTGSDTSATGYVRVIDTIRANVGTVKLELLTQTGDSNCNGEYYKDGKDNIFNNISLEERCFPYDLKVTAWHKNTTSKTNDNYYYSGTKTLSNGSNSKIDIELLKNPSFAAS